MTDEAANHVCLGATSFPFLPMATVIERDIHHHDSSADSSATLIVTIVALVIIVGFALFFFQLFPFNNTANTDNGGSINIDANLPPAEGNPTPDAMNY